MARGKRDISLAGNNTTSTTTTTTTTSEVETTLATKDTTTMNEQTTETPQDTTLAAQQPDNGDTENDIDEDLQVNVKSSVADKRKAYEKKARAYGRKNAGAAMTSQQLAEMLLEGTCDHVFSIQEIPGGPSGTVKVDDALTYYTYFRMPDGPKSPPVDTSSRSFRSKLSNYQNIIYLAQNHVKDAQAWFGSVVDIYNANAVKADVKASMKDLNGVFEYASDVVREQLARDTATAGGSAPLLDDDEILQAMMKPTPQRSTDPLLDLIIESFKKLSLARDGKKANKDGKGGFAGVGIGDKTFTDIIQSLHDWAFKLDPARKQAFTSATGKGKKTRRHIDPKKMAGATPNGGNGTTSTDNDEEAEAQEQGNAE